MARFKRYQVWDEVSDVITPSGEVFTADEWIVRYPMAMKPEVKLVISGGVINGAFCGELNTMINAYEANGCDFSNCIEDQDYLDAIELFEDEFSKPQEGYVDPNERIAAALEAIVMLSLPDVEEEFNNDLQ